MLAHLALGVVLQVQDDATYSDAVPVLGGGLVLALLGFLVALRLTGSTAAGALGAAAGSSLAVVLALTLLRSGHGYGYGGLAGLQRCAATAPVLLSADGVANALLLAPTVLLAVLAVGRPVRAVGAAAAVSLVVEGLQAVWSVGVCDSSDWLLNTLGASAAALVAVVVRTAFVSARRPAVGGSAPCRGSS